IAYLASYYQTRGALAIPLLTLHTAQDPDVPFFHEAAYAKIVAAARASKWLAQQSVQRYGHCNVTPAEVAITLGQLVKWAEKGVKPVSGDVTLNLALASPESATGYVTTTTSGELAFDEAILPAASGLTLPESQARPTRASPRAWAPTPPASPPNTNRRAPRPPA